MGNGLSHMVTSAYIGLVKRVFPVGDYATLNHLTDLDNNPVLQNVLCVFSGEIYHRFGLAVAPLTLMLITVQFVDVLSQTWGGQHNVCLSIEFSTR